MSRTVKTLTIPALALAASVAFSASALAQAENVIISPAGGGYNDLTMATRSNVTSASPVMIIRFNQKNVYFQTPLKRVVGKVDASKPAAHYVLQSIVPAGEKRNPANDKDFDENLRNVVTVLGLQGVPVDNIAVTSETSQSIDNQEVHIFVK